jgi:hypothetical protein
MDIGSIFLLLALVVLVVFFVAQPFFTRQRAIPRPVGGARQQIALLRMERARVIQALQELDFDNSLGKVPAEDYPVQRNALLLHGAEVLQQLDALQPQPSARENGDRLEAALAARRKDISQASAPTAAPDESGDLERLIAARRRARNGSAPREKSIGFCPQCGKSLQKSDRFCPKCGTELK